MSTTPSEVPPLPNPATPTYTRDKDYYFEDGSLVILAEGHLFKIHRTLFERDSPFFRSLLSLPLAEDQKSQEGQSDENPVVCPDYAEDFQALCWVVYSRPADILTQQEWMTSNIPKLIRVVAISYKYDFTVYREWALTALEVHSAAHPSDFLHKCGRWRTISRLLNIAIECGKKSLADRLQQTLLDQISSSSKRTAALKKALDVTEGSGLPREFHATCYYLYLQSSGVFGTTTQGTVPIDLSQIGSHMGESLVELGNERQMRLLTGFWSLTQLRVGLTQPPKLVDSPSCGQHSQHCIPAWEAWWKDVLQQAAGTSDPGKLINHMIQKAQVRIVGPRPTGYHSASAPETIPCSTPVISTILSLKKDFDASLAERFMVS